MRLGKIPHTVLDLVGLLVNVDPIENWSYVCDCADKSLILGVRIGKIVAREGVAGRFIGLGSVFGVDV